MSADAPVRGVTRAEFARLESCDEKQVRRGIAAGKLVLDANGLLDPAQVGCGWRRPRTDTRERAGEGAATAGGHVRSASGETISGVPIVLSAEGARLKNAVAHKEDFAGRLKELEYRQRAGELIDLELARQVLFEEFRAARDAWLNWPTRFAALIAADLGIEADRVSEVLTTYVHKQLASLGEPSGQFRKG